jgi:hypothetical protein
MNEPLVSIEEQPDPKELANRLEAQRVTLHWKTGGTKVLPDYTKGPLFGSGEQFGMFSDSETEG